MKSLFKCLFLTLLLSASSKTIFADHSNLEQLLDALSDDAGIKTSKAIDESKHGKRKPLALNTSGWVIVSTADPDKNKQTTVPLQNDNERDYSYSCGPISIARGMELLDIKKPTSYWQDFIFSFDYFDFGVFPHNLVKNVNEKYLSDTNIAMTHELLKNFDDVKRVLRTNISEKNNPVIALIVWSATEQHYVNIVGYNDKEKLVLVLDTENDYRVESYEWLDDVMYAGFSDAYGNPYALASTRILPLFSHYTTYDYYNLFTFERIKPLSDQVNK